MTRGQIRRIHIVGTGPRSGTTLLFEMMAASFDVAAIGHETPVTQFFSKSKPVLTKFPAEMDRAAARLMLDPRLFVIMIMRDPRDVVSSRHRKAPNKYWTSFRLWRDAVKSAASVRKYPQFLCVKYEDLVRDPDAVQRAIVEALPGLSDSGSFSSYTDRAAPTDDATRALGGVRAASSASVSKWRQSPGRALAQAQRHPDMLDRLIEFGYEPDASWVERIDAPPDMTPSYWGDSWNYFGLRHLRYLAGGLLGALRGGVGGILGGPA